MPKNRYETLRQVEQTQQALRQSIEAAKELADRSERLIALHRRTAGSGRTEPD